MPALELVCAFKLSAVAVQAWHPKEPCSDTALMFAAPPVTLSGVDSGSGEWTVGLGSGEWEAREECLRGRLKSHY